MQVQTTGAKSVAAITSGSPAQSSAAASDTTFTQAMTTAETSPTARAAKSSARVMRSILVPAATTGAKGTVGTAVGHRPTCAETLAIYGAGTLSTILARIKATRA